jgi:3-methyladenine DNA glycosylase AlkD
MRHRGIAYKINFGLTIQQIKDLAGNYIPDKDLAERLWKEDTRELKILATLLYPPSAFDKGKANEWIKGISNQEVREQVSINLFQNLPYASELVEEWSSNTEEEIRTTAYWLLARLFIAKKITSFSVDQVPYIWEDVIAENMFLRNAALLALRHLGRQSEHVAKSILEKIESYKDDRNLIKKEAYDSLAFEFEYYFEP